MNERGKRDGVHAVLYALFRADERLDHGAMAAQVEYCVEKGCHGITVLGLATEVLKLTAEERTKLVSAVGRAVDGRLQYSVTIAGNSVAEQAELSRSARDSGADWLILQPPMAGTYGPGVYLDFFASVAASSDLPVALQNAPQYLGRALSAEDIMRLCDKCPNVFAVKSEDSALGVQQLIEQAGDRVEVLGGRGGLEMTDSLRMGCRGFVLAPDIAPVAARIFELWQDGNIEQAEELYARAVPAVTFVMQSLEHLVTYGKRIFAANAGLVVHDRAPCLEATDFGISTADRWARVLRELA